MKRFISSVGCCCLMSGMAFAAEDGAAIYKAKCAMCHGAGWRRQVGPGIEGNLTDSAQIS